MRSARRQLSRLGRDFLGRAGRPAPGPDRGHRRGGRRRSARCGGLGAPDLDDEPRNALERGIPLDEIPKRLADAGLTLAELELVRVSDDGPTRCANALVEDLIEVLRPNRVHTAAFTGDLSAAADRLAELCERHPDTPVAVEFMPYSVVRNLAEARRPVHAGTPNAAIVLDIVHVLRSGSAVEEIDAEALRNVAVVQLSDVSSRPGVDLAREARHLRTYPGRGNLDTVAFLRRIRESTAELPPLSVEPVSDALERLPLEVVTEEIMFSALRVLEQSALP